MKVSPRHLSDDTYKMSMAEFKGSVIQSLVDIKDDIQELKDYNRDTRVVALVISGISGVISGFFGGSIIKNK